MPAKRDPSTDSKRPRTRRLDWPARGQMVTVPVDRGLYPLEVIHGAAYVLMDRAFVLLEPGEGDTVQVRLCGRDPLDDDGLRRLGGEFANELTNQALRATLDESGRKIREYIIAKSHFFHDQGGQDIQSLLDATMLEAFDDDPLDIAVPWEEKYGDGGKGGS
jgi:His-Xaa-Ser system protein HxsD